jgi:Flp pilus assembly protein CpaB
VVTWNGLQRAFARRRRLVAAVLAGLAVLSAVAAVRPPAPPSVVVLAAAHDLAPGTALALADLRPVPLPAAAVPAGALRPGAEVLGRLVAGPVRRGEPLTDVRLVGPALLAALGPGTVAVPVRFADAGAVALLRPGDRVDVLAAPTGLGAAWAAPAAAPGAGRHPGRSPDGAEAGSAPVAASDPSAGPAHPDRGGSEPVVARVVAADVAVLAVPPTDAGLGGGALGDGALVLVACSPAVARALAAAATHARLSPALRAPAAPP